MRNQRTYLLAAAGLTIVAIADGVMGIPGYPLVLAAAVLVIVAIARWWGSRATADPAAVTQAWVDAWNSHDANAVAALFTLEAVHEDAATGAVYHGPAQVRALAQFFIDGVPDLKVEVVSSGLRGGHWTIEWVFSGTDMGIYQTGENFSVRSTTVLHLEGAKIARCSDSWGLVSMVRARLSGGVGDPTGAWNTDQGCAVGEELYRLELGEAVQGWGCRGSGREREGTR